MTAYSGELNANARYLAFAKKASEEGYEAAAGLFRAAARATAAKDRRVNIRLSSGDLQDIQVRALEEGLPYQTLIASVLHKYVTGRLAERDGSAKDPKSAG
jgi:predicted DNA binding CopG/RHH family protein